MCVPHLEHEQYSDSDDFKGASGQVSPIAPLATFDGEEDLDEDIADWETYV